MEQNNIEEIKFSKRFQENNHIFVDLEIDQELLGNYILHKGYNKACKTRVDKKYNNDSQIKKINNELDSAKNDHIALVEFTKKKAKKQLDDLSIETSYMLKFEDFVDILELKDGTTCYFYTAYNGEKIEVAEKNKNGIFKIANFENIVPTAKQKELYEEFCTLRSTKPMGERQKRTIEKKIEKVYAKDPTFLNKYAAECLKNKIATVYGVKFQRIIKEAKEKVEEIELKHNAKIKQLTGKLEYVKQKYNRYAKKLIQQREYKYIVDNVDKIAMFAKTLGLENEVYGPYVTFKNNGVPEKISLTELSLATLLLKAKTGKFKEEKVCYVSKEKVNKFAKVLETEVFADKTFNQYSLIEVTKE